MPCSLLLLVAAAALQEPPPDPAVVRGRFVHADKRPVAELSVRLRGWRSSPERVARHGVPESWSDPVAVTDADGRFELTCDPPPAFQFMLTSSLAGFAQEAWRWSSLAPGETRDLGDVTVRPGGTLRGRVVDADGEPILSGWSASAEAPAPELRNGRRGTVESGDAGDEPGSFVIRDLPAGTCRVTVRMMDGQRVHSEAEIRAGEVVEIELVHVARADPEILVTLVPGPIRSARPSLDHVTLTGPGLERFRPTHSPTRSAGIDFAVPAGEYVLRIDDPRFESFEQSGLTPGAPALDVRLAGNSAVRVHATDAYTGEPLERLGVHVRVKNTSFRPHDDQSLGPRVGTPKPERWELHLAHVFALITADRPFPADGVLAGLVAGDYELMVGAPGRATAYLDLDALAPNETRAFDVALVEGGSVTGTVIDASTGLGVPDATVALFRPGDETKRNLGFFYEGEDVLRPHHERGGGRERALGTTDAEGAFELAHVEPGAYVLRVHAGSVLELRERTVGNVWIADGERAVVNATLPAD